MSDTQDDEIVVEKPKKPRTEAQLKAWQKAQEIRIANAKAKKEAKTTEYVEKKIETLKKKLPEKKPSVIQETNSETDEEPEPQITVIRVPAKSKPKPKPKPKKEIRVELEEEEFTDEEPEPITKPKVAPQKPQLKAVQKESPVAPKLYFV